MCVERYETSVEEGFDGGLNFEVRMYLPSIHKPLPTAANTPEKSKSARPSPVLSGVTHLESIFTQAGALFISHYILVALGGQKAVAIAIPA
ncbi:hypothetical protein [Pseudomonas sp. EL_65y_Pfl1_R83]|uniref:hypothetical protein n=1 Tax=Pseudomonas sp. EL_65y_Pfl1_R83 TaxID=3088697 RepID=UPI0030D9354E